MYSSHAIVCSVYSLCIRFEFPYIQTLLIKYAHVFARARSCPLLVSLFSNQPKLTVQTKHGTYANYNICAVCTNEMFTR